MDIIRALWGGYPLFRVSIIGGSTVLSHHVATKISMGTFQATGRVLFTGKKANDERGSMANNIVTVP